MFMEQNICNWQCLRCGKESLTRGQGHVPPGYFEEELSADQQLALRREALQLFNQALKSG
jgi:hypothetical protein